MNVLLGITGGIAAYKAPELVRRLRERGANVRVVMTKSAHRFVTATTLQAVSGAPVRDDLWDAEAEAAMGHIELARWADCVLVAPATAEFLSRLAQGSAVDLLTTLCLATEAPIALAPAMNHVMWSNPAVQANASLVESRGVRILGPGIGEQACGECGPGRMLEPDQLVTALLEPGAGRAAVPGPMSGLTVMVTAGPTREMIDPVRYISNRSSGKMGYAMAEAARDAGARVILVSGPVNLPAPDGIERIMIGSANEMFDAVHARIGDCDVFIAAAAVADYRPAEVAGQKIKKTQDALSMALVRAPDILASVASLDEAPFTVGFAAETDRAREYALGKLEAKKLDMIIANEVGDGKAFGRDDNSVHVFWRTGDRAWPLTPKRQLAAELVALIAEHKARGAGAGTVAELPQRASGD
jgi:phosphopantothenoylcysteine decarboxylase/phosphopantothenate--cysteine ligase